MDLDMEMQAFDRAAEAFNEPSDGADVEISLGDCRFKVTVVAFISKVVRLFVTAVTDLISKVVRLFGTVITQLISTLLGISLPRPSCDY